MAVINAAVIAERRIVSSLLRSRAVTPETAAPLEGLSWIASRRLTRLVNAGVIIEASPERYYLDTPSLADRWESRRRRVAFALLIVFAMAGATMYYASTQAAK